jgi:superfamily II DNA or RNA helicase
MSCKTTVNVLTSDMCQQIDTKLTIKLEDTKYGMGQVKYIYPHEIIGNDVYLPFAFAYTELKLSRPIRTNFPSINVKFKGHLRPEQIIVRDESLSLLNRKGSVLTCAHVGFGKTACCINLACCISFKTLIIVNKIHLMKQWEESILKFCPNATVQKLTAQSKMKDCDFYIMNAINVPKMGKNFFKDIGLCAIDECHLIMAETLSKSLQYVHPRYLIGLTATPYRPDGLNILLELYFGKFKIIRKLYRKHIAYKINTGFKPVSTLARNGKVNWGSVLDSQANDPARNELIIKIVKHYSERVFLILTKRVAQGKHLVDRLEEEGEDVTSLFGSNQEYEQKSRILVGTSQKCGIGFDHPRLDALILASDLEEYFIQYLGRCFRTKEVEPIIFDLVDNNPILNRHFNTRRSVYIEHGGSVRTLDIDF